MNIQPRWTKSAVNLCAEFGEEDGIDPRYIVSKSTRERASRKNLQICKEASRIISLVLTGETHHPLLRDLLVLWVQPEATGSLCVTVGHYTADFYAETEVQAALKQVQGFFRSALANALHRKHIPLLTFRYAGVIGKGEL